MEKETLIVVYTICDNGITILHISAATRKVGLFQDDDVKKFKFLGNFGRSYNNRDFEIGNSLELAILCMTLLWGNEPGLCLVSVFQQKSPFLSSTMSII